MAEERQHEFDGQVIERRRAGAVTNLGKELGKGRAGDAAFADLVEPEALVVEPEEAKPDADDEDDDEQNVFDANRLKAANQGRLQSAQINRTVACVPRLGQRHLVIDR